MWRATCGVTKAATTARRPTAQVARHHGPGRARTGAACPRRGEGGGGPTGATWQPEEAVRPPWTASGRREARAGWAIGRRGGKPAPACWPPPVWRLAPCRGRQPLLPAFATSGRPSSGWVPGQTGHQAEAGRHHHRRPTRRGGPAQGREGQRQGKAGQDRGHPVRVAANLLAGASRPSRGAPAEGGPPSEAASKSPGGSRPPRHDGLHGPGASQAGR